MTFMKRIISTLTAIAIVLGISAGTPAQGSDTVGVSVTLTDEQVCSIDITSTGDFGTWTWNGTTYNVTSATSTVEFTGTFPTMPPSGTCNVNVGFTGLTDATGVNTIPATSTYFHATSFDPEADQSPFSWSKNNVTGPTFTFTYKLTSVPNLPAGSYTGLIKVDVANAA